MNTISISIASFSETFRHARKRDMLLIVIGTLGAVATGVSLPLFYVLMGEMMDQLNLNNSAQYDKAVKELCFAFLTIGCVNLLSGFLQVSCWSHIGERLTQQYREEYVRAMLRQEVSWFDAQGRGTLATKVTELTSKVQAGLGKRLGDVVQYSTQFIFAFAVAFYYNWELALVLLSAFPFIALSVFVLVSAVAAVTTLSLEQYALAGSIAAEALGAIRTLTALNAQPDTVRRYRHHLFQAMDIGVRKGLQVGIGSGMLYGSMFLTYALGFWYGARLVADSQSRGCQYEVYMRNTGGFTFRLNHSDCPTGGGVMTVFFCAVMGSMALGQMAPSLSAFTSARSAIKVMLETIRHIPAIDGLSEEGLRPATPGRGALVLSDVTFCYPSRPEVVVCQGYSLTVQPGETVALVGASGCGKSTIINLLLRFYNPQCGQVLLDGQDIRHLNIRYLRAQFGYVGQEPVLFPGTIGDNIAYGLNDTFPADTSVDALALGDIELTVARQQLGSADSIGHQQQVEQQEEEEELDFKYSKFPSRCRTAGQALRVRAAVVRAAKLAAAHAFISALPQGYDTEVGNNGVSLSGGQKQRIAIARALVKRPAVLLLDEATSALDAASERLVQESIDALQHCGAGETGARQTMIVIAHRLSTVRSADKICVVEGGCIVETGTHDELICKQGRYAELVRTQLEGHQDHDQAELADPIVSAFPATARVSEQDSEESDDGVVETRFPSHILRNAFEPHCAARLEPDDAASVLSSVLEILPKGRQLDCSAVPRKIDPKIVSKVWAIVMRNPGWFSVSLLGSAVFGAVFPVWGLLLAGSQDMFYKSSGEIRDRSEDQALYYIALAGGAFLSATLQFYGQAQVAERLSLTLRSDLFESILRRDMSFFDRKENEIGNLTARLAHETRLVDLGFGNSVARQMQVAFTLGISLVIGFTASWQIALVVIATLPLNILSAIVQSAVASGQNVDDADIDQSNKAVQGNKEPSKYTKSKGMGTPTDSGSAAGPGGEALLGGGSSAMISTAFMNITTICAFSLQSTIAEQYAELTRQSSARRARGSYMAGLGYGASNFALFTTYALLFWYGASLVKDGTISFKEMMTAILTMLLGALGIGQALMDMGDQRLGLQAATRIFKSIEEGKRELLDGLSTQGQVPETTSVGRIELKGVFFSYPTRPDVSVCEGYDLTIEPGEVVALVGPSGSGKSTIINLLLRFYDPQCGQVLLDGQDIRHLNIRHLRAQFGYVGQEPVLFAGTVRENVARGRASVGAEQRTLCTVAAAMQTHERDKGNSVSAVCICAAVTQCTCVCWHQCPPHQHAPVVTMEPDSEAQESKSPDCDLENPVPEADSDIIEACIQSHADGFIQTFAQGYDTDLGFSGMLVSGGQKQRIAIARALVKRPAVLLLDEATSALDAASERLVQESIDALQHRGEDETGARQTMIVIAHRLSTVRNADKICVVEGGRIVEMGRHETLLEQKGLYWQLWVKQQGCSHSA